MATAVPPTPESWSQALTKRLMAHRGVHAIGLTTGANGKLVEAMQLGTGNRAEPQLHREDGAALPVSERPASSGHLYNARPTRRRLFGRAEPRPVPWGSAIGHVRGLRGTLACRVQDAEGRQFVLSAAHVLTNVGDAETGDAILQPPPQDLGRPGKHTIATLARWVPFHVNQESQTGPVCVTDVDAAIATLTDDTVSTELKHLPGRVVGVARVDSLRTGQLVRLSGASTHLRTGAIQAIGASVRLVHPSCPSKYVLLTNQVLTTPMGAGGDSGSLVVTPTNPSLPVEQAQDYLAVGIFAGGAPAVDGGWSVVGPLERAMAKLGVTLVT